MSVALPMRSRPGPVQTRPGLTHNLPSMTSRLARAISLDADRADASHANVRVDQSDTPTMQTDSDPTGNHSRPPVFCRDTASSVPRGLLQVLRQRGYWQGYGSEKSPGADGRVDQSPVSFAAALQHLESKMGVVRT